MLKTLTRVVLSAFFWVYLATSLMVWWFAVVIPWLLLAPFDTRRRWSHWYAYTWACHYLALSPFWRIHVRGREKIDDSRAAVLAANHASIGDILVLFALRKQFKWVAKAEVFRVPFLGWMMHMAGYVPIHRGSAKSRARMLAACMSHLERGNSIMIFPEGTRSVTPTMRSFKLGAFHLACSAKVPVYPIVLEGTLDLLPRRTWIFQQERVHDIYLHVLDPIDPADYEYDARKVSNAAREAMEAELESIRREFPRAARAAESATAE